MADVKISELPAASSANGAMELEVNDAGSSKKVTINQLQDQVVGTTNGLIARTAANTVAARTLTAATNGGIVVSDGNGVAGNPTISNDFASQAEAEAGTVENKAMNPLRVAQQTTARVASQAEAEAGTDTSKLMTPERVAQAIAAAEPTVSTVSSAKTLSVTDAKSVQRVTAPLRITIPTNANQAISIGAAIPIVCTGDGCAVVVPDTGVTVETAKSLFIEVGATGVLRKLSDDTWSLDNSSPDHGNAPHVACVFTQDVSGNSNTVPVSALPYEEGDLIVVYTGGEGKDDAITDYTAATGSPQSTGSGSTNSNLSVLYKVAGASESDVAVSVGFVDAVCIVMLVKNASSTSPVAVASGATATSSTAVSIASVTTPEPDCLVLFAVANTTDSATDQISAGPTNATLKQLERGASHQTAAGGGVDVFTGIMRAAAATGAVTATLGTASVQAKHTMAIRPL